MRKSLLIIMAFLISYLVANYAVDSIFLANGPRLNPLYITNLRNQFQTTISKATLALSFDKIKNSKINIFSYIDPESIPTSHFRPIIKGVSAYNQENGNITIKINNKEANIKLREIELNGKKIEVIDLTGE